MDDSAIDAAHTLADPVRRRLYEYVAESGREVGRAEAAEEGRTRLRDFPSHSLARLFPRGLHLQVALSAPPGAYPADTYAAREE